MALYITITGQKHYFGLLPFSVGNLFTLSHDPENMYDAGAISVLSPRYGKVGAVAQSKLTLAEGTVPAEVVLPLLTPETRAKVIFIAGEYIIAEIC